MLVVLSMLLWPSAAAAAPLVLEDATPVVHVWPALTLLAEPDGAPLTAEEALAAPQRFAKPPAAAGSLGLRQEAVWLRIPFELREGASRRWILDIDYPALNRIDVHLARDGRIVQQARLGNLQPRDSRPMASRSHAVPLALEPGARHELLLRVQTQGALILPITLNQPAAFHARAMGEQMLQGLLGGLGLCLLLYSLSQWITLREPLFGKYAVLISGSLLFSLFQFGIGAQYLWPGNLWMERHAGGLAALLATCGSFLFIEQVLAGPGTSRWFSRAMKTGAALTVAIGLVYALDVIDTRVISAIVSLLGLLPALMGLPGAIRLTRRGDPVGACFLLAWFVYLVSTAIMIAVINGRLPADFWTLHSFQFGATIDMLLFMRVLGLRMKAVHAAAQHATRERDALRSLAHTDALTGLPNRRGLNAALAAALPHCSAERLLALYLLDLDGFKPVNDRYGHDVGDELLVVVAQRLQAGMRSSDVVARLGGDEFVVLIGGLADEHQAHERGSQMLEALRRPIELGEHRCSVGLTIGYVLAPLDGSDAASLLKRADAAMYAGKQAGKRCLRRGGGPQPEAVRA
jgi:diguanylate cyclase (GGDEF)-like protein